MEYLNDFVSNLKNVKLPNAEIMVMGWKENYAFLLIMIHYLKYK